VKPAPFAYAAPASLEEALGVLAEVGADGKVLAGGQSLIPILNMRLAAPEHLVDINRVPGLDTVEAGADGVRVGALVRHAALERDAAAGRVLPLLRQALTNVAHPVIRNRGTTVGSIAHADPSGEMTAVLALVEGSVEAASTAGRRTIPASEFFVGPLENALRPGEMLVSAFFPASPEHTGTAFVEVARRHGDYALCGLAAAVTVDVDARIRRARVALISVAPTPLVVDVTDALAGRPAASADLAAAAAVVRGAVDPEPDIHASADYRRHLAGVLTERGLRAAAARALPTNGAA
jgi:carbon-monoxide dehydrogenase medium subunit